MKKFLFLFLATVLFCGCGDTDFQLLSAAEEGRAGKVKALLQRGANPDVSTDIDGDDGWTPLILAAQNGHAETVELLLQSGADVNASTEKGGITPLRQASQQNHADIVRLLLNAGAKPDVSDLYQRDAPLKIAEDAEIVQLLLDAGADPNKTNQYGFTALTAAAELGNADKVILLLQAGADVNAASLENETALMAAAFNGHADVVKLLLQFGADVNAVDKDSMTPLMYASWEGHGEVVKLILQAGADANAEDKNLISRCPVRTLSNEEYYAKYSNRHTWVMYGINYMHLGAGASNTALGKKLSKISYPSRTLMATDATAETGWGNLISWGWADAYPYARHSGRCNAIWLDGHVESIPTAALINNEEKYWKVER